jgi:hypothetical protein
MDGGDAGFEHATDSTIRRRSLQSVFRLKKHYSRQAEAGSDVACRNEPGAKV